MGATYGTNHPSPLRHFWERWPLPAPVKRWLPADGWGADWPSPGPELQLWFRTDRTPSPEFSYRWDLADETGLLMADFSARQLAATNGATGLRVDYGAFPRHGRTLRLVAHHFDRAADGYRPVLELELPNPHPHTPAAPAVVPPLPQTVHAGDLAFTLTTFTTGLQRQPGFALRPASSTTIPCARLDFLAASNGVPNREWFPLNARIRDLENHTLNSSPIEWLGAQNGWLLKLEPAPWAGQPWRIRVEFSRNDGFAPEELVTFHRLRIAGQHGVAVDQHGRAGGRELELEFLEETKPREREWQAKARLVRRESGVSLTLAGARDQRGRKLWQHPRHLTFRAWPDTESVDLTFAVHPSRFGEFVAEPVDVRNN